MIDRYAREPMKQLWSLQTKFQHWLLVELAILKARFLIGHVPQKCYEDTERHASFSVQEIHELEGRFGHDMVAFVECVRARLRAAGVFPEHADQFHAPFTSYDIEDPAFMLMLFKAGELIAAELGRLEEELLCQAKRHQWTLMIDRTHGQDGEPGTFGRLLLEFADAVHDDMGAIARSMETDLRVGKMNGLTGIYAGLDPRIEERACHILGLRPARITTQIIARSRHARFHAVLTVAGATIERMMETFWLMMHSGNRELQEPRKEEQRGSSRDPKKRNPIRTEGLYGKPRVLRGNLQAAIENVRSKECRDISQSSVERIIWPDTTTLLHHMAGDAAGVVRDLAVFPQRMRKNLDRTFGTWAAPRIRDALVRAGVHDSRVYTYLQGASFEAVDREEPLESILGRKLISETDPRTAREILGADALSQCFDAMAYIRPGIETIFARFA